MTKRISWLTVTELFIFIIAIFLNEKPITVYVSVWATRLSLLILLGTNDCPKQVMNLDKKNKKINSVLPDQFGPNLRLSVLLFLVRLSCRKKIINRHQCPNKHYSAWAWPSFFAEVGGAPLRIWADLASVVFTKIHTFGVCCSREIRQIGFGLQFKVKLRIHFFLVLSIVESDSLLFESSWFRLFFITRRQWYIIHYRNVMYVEYSSKRVIISL